MLCAGSLPCLRNWTSRLPLKKRFWLFRSCNSWVSPWALLTCRPVSLRISLTKHGQCYWGGYPNEFATCGTSCLLFGPFSLPVGSLPRVRPSCNALLTLQGIFPSQCRLFFSMTISQRIFTCGTFFSITGMVSASFFPLYTETAPDIHLYTDAAGWIGYGAFYDNRWYQDKWLPSHHLSCLTGVSITWQELYPIYLDARSRLPFGPVGEFASTVTTRLSLLFCLPRAPKFSVWWTL